MHGVAFCRRYERAYLFQALLCQPALAATALDSETIGGFLIGPAKLVPALMGVDPLLDRGRNAFEQSRIHDEEAGVGCAIVIELAVDDGRALTAELLAAVECKFTGLKDVAVATGGRDVLIRRRYPILYVRARILCARAWGRYQTYAQAEAQDESADESPRCHAADCFQNCPG